VPAAVHENERVLDLTLPELDRFIAANTAARQKIETQGKPVRIMFGL